MNERVPVYRPLHPLLLFCALMAPIMATESDHLWLKGGLWGVAIGVVLLFVKKQVIPRYFLTESGIEYKPLWQTSKLHLWEDLVLIKTRQASVFQFDSQTFLVFNSGTVHVKESDCTANRVIGEARLRIGFPLDTPPIPVPVYGEKYNFGYGYRDAISLFTIALLMGKMISTVIGIRQYEILVAFTCAILVISIYLGFRWSCDEKQITRSWFGLFRKSMKFDAVDFVTHDRAASRLWCGAESLAFPRKYALSIEHGDLIERSIPPDAPRFSGLSMMDEEIVEKQIALGK